MTKFDLFDSIGNVDDELIEKATETKISSKKVFWAITSVAACAVFVCVAALIVLNLNKSNNTVIDSGVSSAIGASSEFPMHEDSGETAIEQMPFEVYYVVNGTLKQKTFVINASPEKLFDLWKKENQIGDEVRFISAKISDNGSTEISEYSGVEVATHKVGDNAVYTLTITKNLEKYYESTGKELLLDSLKKTMTEMCDPKPDDYQLILSNNSEESESNRIDPNDIQYNDRGEILE